MRRQMVANEGGNAEVWAMVRGAGTTLGVVVQLTLQLHDVSGYHGVRLSCSDSNGANLR